mgnify:CR=1 FL=1
MIAFIIVVFVLAATPGPALLSIVGAGSAFGFRGGLPYTFGALLGANIVIILSIVGFASILMAAPNLKIFLSIVSLSYLVYVALQVAGSNQMVNDTEKKPRLGVINGVIIQLLNPKAYAVGIALFSGFPLAINNMLSEVIIKLLLINSIFVPAYFLWLFFGEILHARLSVTTNNKTVNVSLALLMMLSVVISAISIFT